MFHVPEKNRISRGPMASDSSHGNNGAFYIDRGRTQFFVIASNGEGWEHVSVHAVTDKQPRTPTWAEMCFIKGIFWDDEDCVIQYHPAKSEYINNHKHTLHLWRPAEQVIPMPNKYMVGIPDAKAATYD